MLGNVFLNLFDDFMFNIDVLEDGFNHHIGCIKSRILYRTGVVGGDSVGFKLRQPFLFN
jgi:hypothetical protein